MLAKYCPGACILLLCCAVSAVHPARSATTREEDAARIAGLVTANHILASLGVLDGFGHISVRSAANPNHVSQVPLRPVAHMAGFLARAVPVFEIRESAGNGSDMLIRNKEIAAALATKLAGGTVVLLRGHGDVVVGNSIRTAVLHAVYTDLDAHLESEALALGGKITFLNETEAAKIGAINDQQAERPWESWKRSLDANDPKP